jgi:hypothetical protein
MLAKSDNDMFIPKKLETTVKYEGKNLSSYPVLDSDAPNAERVHALLCNRHAAAAEASNLGPYQTITFVASCSNLDAAACVLISQWTGRLIQLWSVPDQLEVLSYYDSDGAVIASVIDPATNVLHPTFIHPYRSNKQHCMDKEEFHWLCDVVFRAGLVFSKTWVKKSVMDPSCQHNFLVASGHQQPLRHNKQESATFIHPYGSNKQHYMDKEEFHWLFGIMQGC